MRALPVDHRPTAIERLRRAVLAMLVLLLCQFALGIAANLYTAIPDRHPGAHPNNYLSGSAQSIGWAIGHGGLILAVHALLGFALVAAALATLVLAFRLRNARIVAVIGTGAAFVIGAGFNGASFLDFASNTSSLIMAMLFALATLAYAAVLYVLPTRQGPPSLPATSSTGAMR
jgi:hypothetical protein